CICLHSTLAWLCRTLTGCFQNPSPRPPLRFGEGESRVFSALCREGVLEMVPSPSRRPACLSTQGASTTMTLAVNTRLGPYEILCSLGSGGMGEVYRARDSRLERDVAVKVLPERLAQDATALARFQREARAVANLSHPNIIAVYDTGIEQGMP